MASLKIYGSVIDGQNDFSHKNGSLFVPGADADSPRIARLMMETAHVVKDWFLTMDAHPFNHIAHPSRWVSIKTGKNPTPFTIISKGDLAVYGGEWKASHPALDKMQQAYVETLDSNGRYVLCIWPVHCEIGSWGQNFTDDILMAIRHWSVVKFGTPTYILKGSNPHTEHYSGVQADVVDPRDITTQLNTVFIRGVEESDVFILAGQASSHCVANTATDLLVNLSSNWKGQFILAEDCMSPVPGFEFLFDNLKAKFAGRIELWTSDKIIRTFR